MLSHHTCCLQCKNVLLTKDWQKAKIADVGLSRVLGHTQTTSTMPMGTFAYAGSAQCTGLLVCWCKSQIAVKLGTHMVL